jgi:enoyl-CoA hydratase
MADAPLLVSREGAIALLTINRPDKRNALNRDVLEHLYRAFTELRGSDCRVAILTGAGDKAFVAGADIAAMKGMTTAEAKAFADLGHRTGDLMESVPFPIIAAVNGFALGGGCELAMACDLIYASENAQFGQPEVKLAVIPGFGGTQRLPRRVGLGKARELVLTGEMIDAKEAHRIGLCEAVVPHADLQTHVRKVAEKIASNGPLAIAQAKVVLRRGDPTLPSANELEAQAFAMLFGTSDQKEGMTAFLEKRPPTFTSS